MESEATMANNQSSRRNLYARSTLLDLLIGWVVSLGGLVLGW